MLRLQVKEIRERYRFESAADRLGPDLLFMHWRLYFQRLAKELCEQKFKRFGEGAEFRPGAYAITCSKIELGNRVVIRPQSMLFADPRPDGVGIRIEDGALIGSGVHIYTGNHNFDNPNIPIIDQGHGHSRPVVIEAGCWIGAGVVILPGVTVGENAVVGAGSVVTKPVPPRTVFAGNPAVKIKDICAE